MAIVSPVPSPVVVPNLTWSTPYALRTSVGVRLYWLKAGEALGAASGLAANVTVGCVTRTRGAADEAATDISCRASSGSTAVDWREVRARAACVR